MNEIKVGDFVAVNSPALKGCIGRVLEEKLLPNVGALWVIEFCEVPNKQFALPCTQWIGKEFVTKV